MGPVVSYHSPKLPSFRSPYLGADLEQSNDKPLRGKEGGMCARVCMKWQGLMDSDHTTWFETLRMMHTQAFLIARSHKEVWGSDFSLHGTGRHAVKTQSESRHFASNLSLQIIFPALSRFLDLLLRRHPLPGPWFGCNSRDRGTQGQLSLSPPPNTLGTRTYTHTTRAISWRLDFFFFLRLYCLQRSKEPLVR